MDMNAMTEMPPKSADVPLLAVKGLTKIFGGTAALDDVTLTIDQGEIRGLIGENGSGKSTFVKVLAGYHIADQGSVEVGGEPKSSLRSQGAGRQERISFVHQDLGLMDELTIFENFFANQFAELGRRPLRERLLSKRARIRELTDCMHRYNIFFDDVDAPVSSLSALQKALLAIMRAGYSVSDPDIRWRVLVLDEPTVYLPEAERRELYQLVTRVASDGVGVILVSHDIDEVLGVAHTVTVLRGGRVVGTSAAAETTREQLIEMMIGHTPSPAHVTAAPTGSRPDGPIRPGTALAARNLSGLGISNINLSVAEGEIVGLAGLAGSGYEVVTRLLYGVLPLWRGELSFGHTNVRLSRFSPATALEFGTILIPRDRIREGGIQSLPVYDNMVFALKGLISSFGFINKSAASRLIHEQLKRFDVRPPDASREFWTLSGGNQQKSIFAKWSALSPRVMLLEEPTQGVDIGARGRIQQEIKKLASQGTAVLVSSADHSELLELCDRVVIMISGRVGGTLEGGHLTRSNLASAVYGDRANEAPTL